MITRALIDRFPVDPPATSWIMVSGLSDPGWLIEIEAEAVLPDDRENTGVQDERMW